MKYPTKLIILAILAAVLAGCSDDAAQAPAGDQAAGGEQAEGKKERKILYWVAPMDPNYRRDKPGKSPMGMDLIPVYADEEGEDNSVKISPAVIQNLGVRTAVVERARLGRLIETVGYVRYDESRLVHVHPRTDGWIERLLVESEGERVRKGQLLYTLYSPTLVNAQEEYLQGMRSGNKILLAASRERLIALGVSEDQIERLRRTRKVMQTIEFRAPQDGIVATLKVRAGMYVQPATEMMQLADLSTVWLLAEVFEQQVHWTHVGDPAEVRLSFLPGRVWEGKVEYIYPNLDPRTRTLTVRLRFDNPDEALKPNMYANVRIYGGFKPGILVIPREALIRMDSESRVIVALGEGRFAPRVVKPGIESGDWVEIVDGLKEGEKVVVSGQFLIDSEASIKASMMRMTEPEPSDGEGGPPGPVTGRGRVEGVMADHGMVKLAHEPIEALGWPSMTMDFFTARGVDLSGLEKGQEVEFELRKEGDRWIISSIGPAGKGEGGPVTGRGRVEGVMADHGMVKLAHEPIEALGWPSMTMDFFTAKGVDLSGLEKGQEVEFELRKEGDRWLITSIRPVK